jgi:flagellar basal body P-ring formation protein FlgA
MIPMKQASDSLLTLYPILFRAKPGVSVVPRDERWSTGRFLTPFRVFREIAQSVHRIVLGKSCPPRSSVRIWSGEGRIRSLLVGEHFFLIAFCITLFAAQPTFGGASLLINLKEVARVGPGPVLLKDVAGLQGFEADLTGRIGAIQVAPSPEFGVPNILTRRQISEIIQSAAGSLTDTTFAGAAAVQVWLKGRPLEPGEIEPVLRAHLSETTQWEQAEIAVHSLSNLTGIEVPPGEVLLRVSSRVSVAGRNRMLVPIEIVQSGTVLRCFWITAEVRIRAELLTAARKIPLGRIITEGDVMRSKMDIPDLGADYARQTEDIIGKVTRRNFSPGDPLTREAFANPLLVKNGDTVHLRLERNGIVLTSLVRAEQDGRLGQVIRVRNLDFSSSLKAQVVGRAEVKIP